MTTVNQSDLARRKIVECLKCQPATTPQIVARTSLTLGHVGYGIQMLKEMGVVQVLKYVKGSQNRDMAVYEWTGKEIPEIESGLKHSNDRDRVETDDQARAFAAALNGLVYDNEEEGRDVKRIDLSRHHAMGASSLA